MTNAPDKLTPATAADIEAVLSFALRFDGRKRIHTGDEFIARIFAEQSAEHAVR